MVAAIEQIEQEITALKAAAAVLAQKTHRAYGLYLTSLGQAVRQHLILASFHVCTQAYPQAFLELSLDQRQKLQQDLQQLGQQAELFIQNCLQFLTISENCQGIDPEDLSQSLMQLESAIAEELRRVSREATQLLQAQGILTATPLEMVLEVAAKAEEAGRSITSSPNLLTALIETKDTDEPQEPQIIAIYLQLGEIQFADSTVRTQSDQIRQFLSQLTNLQRDFAKKQQQRVVAEAAAAWRASWSIQQFNQL
jgi:hypothetical protein